MDKTRTMRATVGICCLLLSTLALGWLIGRYIPGEPHAPQAEIHGPENGATYYGSLMHADTIVDISFGSAAEIHGLTSGNKFWTSESELAKMTDEERLKVTTADSWEYTYPDLEMTVIDAKTVSLGAFREWYPHYADTNHYGFYHISSPPRSDGRVFLVEAQITNTSDTPIMMPEPLLWSEDIVGTDDRLRNGVHCDWYMTQEFYGVPSDEFVAYTVPEDWNIIGPGETQTRTFPYLLFEEELREAASFTNPDLSNYCLAFSDYDPPTIYRLWLG